MPHPQPRPKKEKKIDQIKRDLDVAREYVRKLYDPSNAFGNENLKSWMERESKLTKEYEAARNAILRARERKVMRQYP